MTAHPFCISAALPVAGGVIPDPAPLKRIAIMADRDGLDFLMLQQPGDAVIAASWLIPATQRIGLVSIVGATYAQPFHIARSLSAMDILSSGRMGWAPQAGQHQAQGPFFGNLTMLPPAQALDRAMECVAATESLWDSWDQDALIIDKASARYLDSGKIRRVDYRGTYLRVMGALNAARPTQGYPVLVADDADLLFDRLQDKADVVLLAAANPADAAQRLASLRSTRPRRVLVKIACDSPIADLVAEWRASGVCDGCHLMPGPLATAEAVLGQTLAELRKRRLLLDESPYETLRARLGLAAPVNPYAAAATHKGA